MNETEGPGRIRTHSDEGSNKYIRIYTNTRIKDNEYDEIINQRKLVYSNCVNITKLNTKLKLSNMHTSFYT